MIGREMSVLFLDESGDHNLEIIDQQYPIFVLGGCIMDLRYHQEVATPLLGEYKKKLFGRDDFIMHTADIARRRGIFHRLTDPGFRSRFLEETNDLISKLEFKIVACAISKNDHLGKYGLAALDPYLLSLNVLVERFVFEVKGCPGSGTGIVVAEARDEKLDNSLRLAWMELRNSGTAYLSASEIRKHLSPDLLIRPKIKNIAGLQIADLVVSPIGRRVLGKPPKQDWEIVRSKFRRSPAGRYLGYGLVVLPKKERAAPE
jgi:hypothetical protein